MGSAKVQKSCSRALVTSSRKSGELQQCDLGSTFTWYRFVYKNTS